MQERAVSFVQFTSIRVQFCPSVVCQLSLCISPKTKKALANFNFNHSKSLFAIPAFLQLFPDFGMFCFSRSIFVGSFLPTQGKKSVLYFARPSSSKLPVSRPKVAVSFFSTFSATFSKKRLFGPKLMCCDTVN